MNAIKSHANATESAAEQKWPGKEVLALAMQFQLAGEGLVMRWPGGGRLVGLQNSGLEIADFRAYSQGDDFRFIDQYALARLDQLVVRLFHDRRSLPLTIFLDTSASMNFGQPNKFRIARDLALVFGLAALRHRDRLTVVRHAGFVSDAIEIRKFDRPQSAAGFIAWLRQTRANALQPSETSIRRILATIPPRGMLLVISDFLPPAGMAEMVSLSAALQRRMAVLQVLSPEELYPTAAPAAELIDSESGLSRRIATGAAAAAHYRKNIAGWMAQLQGAARQYGVPWIVCATNEPIRKIFLNRALMTATSRG